MDVFLGLKPQAESYCPFGAETEFFMEPLKVNAFGFSIVPIWELAQRLTNPPSSCLPNVPQ
jgi:hypothetical protein